MRNEIQKILKLKTFFKLRHLTDNKAKYSFEKPTRILAQNIHSNWLRSLYAKTHKHFPVFLDKKEEFVGKKLPVGFIIQKGPQFDEHKVLEHNLSDHAPLDKSDLKFHLIIPEQEIMQYFIQWQRYRKYWWSSITTTPSLFGVDDIKYEGESAHANIVAKFPWGPQTVEIVSINLKAKEKHTSSLICETTLEGALFILLLDGLSNSTKEEYLRLHRTMAPFKISFALDFKDVKIKETLNELATLLHNKLEAKEISSLLPDFTLSLESQIKENLQMGVAYTAVLSEGTLSNGIFHLMNSSTMLKEQVHVADFETYATLLCGKWLRPK